MFQLSLLVLGILCLVFFLCCCLVVSSSAIECLERLVSEMTNESDKMRNAAHLSMHQLIVMFTIYNYTVHTNSKIYCYLNLIQKPSLSSFNKLFYLTLTFLPHLHYLNEGVSVLQAIQPYIPVLYLWNNYRSYLAEFFHGGDADNVMFGRGALQSVTACTRVAQELLAFHTTVRRSASAFCPLLLPRLLLLILLLLLLFLWWRHGTGRAANIAVSRCSRLDGLNETSQQVMIR